MLAHQGGWDEALVVLAPMVVFFGLLFVANRRARQAEQAAEPEAAARQNAEELADRPD